MLVGRQLPVGALRPGVDAAAELPERRIGVYRHDAVVLAQLGENRSDAGGHRGLSDPALAHHADLEVPPKGGPDLRLELGLPDLVRPRSEVHQSEGGLEQRKAPAPTRGNASRRNEVVGPDPIRV